MWGPLASAPRLVPQAVRDTRSDREQRWLDTNLTSRAVETASRRLWECVCSHPFMCEFACLKCGIVCEGVGDDGYECECV